LNNSHEANPAMPALVVSLPGIPYNVGSLESEKEHYQMMNFSYHHEFNLLEQT